MEATVLLLFAIGVVLLVGGAELLVGGASRLAVALGVAPLVVGLTVVAFGTSSPEIAVSVRASVGGSPDIALGNVVGSNIANVLLILGLSAAVAPLGVSARLVRLDVPLVIALSTAVLLLALDRVIGRADGAILFAGIIIYSFVLIRQGRRGDVPAPPDETAFGETPRRAGQWATAILRIVVGLALLVFGSRLLVDSAVEIATALGISELVVGLTVIAVGTSLPELATSVLASVRGARDIATGNVIGSNIYNLLGVLGLSALLAPAGIPVPTTALTFDLPVMLVAAAACLPIFFIGYTITRWEGVLFVLYYVAYTVYIILDKTGHYAEDEFKQAMIFVLPLLTVTLGGMALRAKRDAWRLQRGKEPRS